MKTELKNWLIESRKELVAAKRKTDDIFEPLIIKITSGALAISFSVITVLANINKDISLKYVWILALGWLILSICVILNILSHIAAKKKFDIFIEKIDNELQNNDEDIDNQCYQRLKAIDVDIKKGNEKLNAIYNKPTAWLLVLGIIAILTFTIVNLIVTN